MVTSNLMDAIRVVKENEIKTSDSYREASKNLTNPLGRDLFVKLSDFERFHYERISALEKSLLETGKFIQYEGREFPLPPVFEIKAAEEAHTKSVMQIISEARDLEVIAEKAYASLAEQVPDQLGKDMFNKLSAEEHIHYTILSDAYWSLNQTGKWK